MSIQLEKGNTELKVFLTKIFRTISNSRIIPSMSVPGLLGKF